MAGQNRSCPTLLTAHYLGRRLESAEPASCLVALLVPELRSAFEALEATLLDVLTLFLAIVSPPSGLGGVEGMLPSATRRPLLYYI